MLRSTTIVAAAMLVIAAAVPSRAALIAHFPFNETSATTATEVVGGHNGTIAGAVHTSLYGGASGIYGDKAVSFDGSGDSITVTPASFMNSATTNNAITLTFNAFGGPAQPRDDTIFFADGPSGLNLNAHIPWSNSNIYWDTGGCCGSTQRINALAAPAQFKGQWNHYAFVKDGANKAIYINGALFLSGTNTAVLTTFNNLYIGASSAGGTNSYQGTVDNFAIFDTALTQTEIQNVMTNGIGIEVGGDNTLASQDVLAEKVVQGAKTVRLQQNLNETMQIAELQAFRALDGANVALQSNGGTATASNSGFGTNPTLVNDNNLAGNHPNEWHSSGTGADAWVQVTLASPQILDSLHVYGRTDCCPTRQDNFDVIIYDMNGDVISQQNVTGVGSDPGSNRLFALTDANAILGGLGGGNYILELDPMSNASDQLTVPDLGMPGLPTILDVTGATLNFEMLGGDPKDGAIYQVLVADSFMGQFANIILPSERPDRWITDYLLIDGTLRTLPIPEPATMSLSLLGLAGLVLRRRRAA